MPNYQPYDRPGHIPMFIPQLLAKLWLLEKTFCSIALSSHRDHVTTRGGSRNLGRGGAQEGGGCGRGMCPLPREARKL